MAVVKQTEFGHKAVRLSKGNTVTRLVVNSPWRHSGNIKYDSPIDERLALRLKILTPRQKREQCLRLEFRN